MTNTSQKFIYEWLKSTLETDQNGSGSFRSDPDPWKSYGSLQPDLSYLQSNWNPIYSKSTGSENNDFTSTDAHSTDRSFEAANFYNGKKGSRTLV
jgi:hypothetical protein